MSSSEPADDRDSAVADAAEPEPKDDIAEQPKEESPPSTGVLAEVEAPEREEEVGSDLIYMSSDHVDGFSNPASRCILKAADIAYVFNHTSINAAHLILALSLDKRAAIWMEDRGFDVEQLREAMIPLLIRAKWKYSGSANDPEPVISTTTDVSNILEAAKRRAGERDNQPAALTDLLDALKDLHGRGRLVPAQKDAPAQIDLRPNLEALNGRLEGLRTLLEDGFRWNLTEMEKAMARATGELAVLLAKPAETPEGSDDGPTPTPPRDETPAWRRPFRLAILGLL